MSIPGILLTSLLGEYVPVDGPLSQSSVGGRWTGTGRFRTC